MKIVDVTSASILAEETTFAKNIFQRAKGLLGKKELAKGKALVINPCNSVHTFFMRFPIDVVFVNKTNKVIAVIPAIPAFRISKIYFHAAYVIELPAGTLETNPVAVGDLLEIK